MRNRQFIYFIAIIRHPLRALEAFFWLMTGKKVRARNRLGALLHNLRSDYQVWQDLNEDFSTVRQNDSLQLSALMQKPPYFQVIILSGAGDDKLLDDSLQSIADQWYPHVDYIIANGHNTPTLHAPGQSPHYYLWITEGDILLPDSLFNFASVINEHTVPIVYSDEDQVTRTGERCFPHFKPSFNKELLFSQDYIGQACVINAELVLDANLDPLHRETRAKILLEAADKEAAVQVASLDKNEKTQASIHHIPSITLSRFHHKSVGVEKWCSSADYNKLLKTFADSRPFRRYKTGSFGFAYLEPALHSEPLVSVIIPTKDTVPLLKKCLNSIFMQTDYEKYEILVVDNNSEEEETFDYFTTLANEPRVRILSHPGAFNYSAINNAAVKEAQGKYIFLLNNDTEILTPTWIRDCLAYATRDDIGAVGVKLYYPDTRIQHAGVFTGIGRMAGHGHRFLEKDNPGYYYRAHIVQQVSAVTAACLCVKKDKFLEVGGLDAENLVVAFNDVDLCLKLDAAGYKNIYLPHVELVHHESVSRGKDLFGAKRERYLGEVTYMQEKWGMDTQVDRFYNPNLTLITEDFAIRTTPPE
ncbi:glycosyltransferase family 2 protein [Temperatibacter marinus]|uniref:Glycosyltransferase family 2 protein n=1 Tax=Temperatibacter marinus TaxID=1456591 RepID=A0AA52EJK4_9PROT|nr:glycosyltransferase family 2 protein [Temperatibacter marinus]WND03221.1 glycosyltransferase family 2 protein [Temperatibacter marinus]